MLSQMSKAAAGFCVCLYFDLYRTEPDSPFVSLVERGAYLSESSSGVGCIRGGLNRLSTGIHTTPVAYISI